MSAIDFKTVVPAAQAGDKAAQNLLMEKFYAWSVTVARGTIRDPEQAKDIAVDFWTWMFTGKGILEYDSAKGAFYSWMEMRLKYRALDAMKKQQPKLVYYSEVQNPDSWDVDPASQLGAMQDLQAIAEGLKPTQRDVFWLLLEGETPAGIAGQCGVTEKRARQLIGQVREAIRKKIGD